MKKLSIIALAVFSLLFLSLFAQEEKKKKNEIVEHYTGVMISTGGGLGGRTMRIDFRIRDYTSEEEVAEYLRILKEEGQDALRRQLEKKNLGNISPSFSTGNDIAFVRAFDQPDGGRLIRIATARRMPFLELYYSGRTVDYPFSIVELRVDSEGKGTGGIIAAAELKFKDNQLTIESYGNQYLKMTNVSRYK